ncbi:MAG: D-alanyl-D-alanine carboxypeptidase [Ruminococcaceae bacterium]|nr:D-alanyl-D-alanine carboxypeptidase [Oscillospiraceae bacterium]
MNKNAILRIVCLLSSLLLLLCALPFSSSAAEITPPSTEEATAVYLKHLESDLLVCSKSENFVLGAGSTVKIMSGLLFCERLSTHTQESIAITEELYAAVPKNHGRSLKLVVGEVVTIEQLLWAAICGSYNDAFYVLATLTSGSLEAFKEEMNARATDMGLVNTVFEDVTGIIDGSRTTAAEMAQIALFAYQNPYYMAICSERSFYFSSTEKSQTLYNNNKLVSPDQDQKYYNKKCFGMNAGSTTRDGNCVVTIAKQNDQTYVCVVMGGKEIDGIEFGYRVANRVVDWVFNAYTYMQILTPDTKICSLDVTVSDTASSVDVIVKDELYAYLPKGLEIGKDIIYSIRLTETELEAPVEKDQFVGYVAVLYDGNVLGSASLYTAGEASRSPIGSGLGAIRSWLENRAVIAGIVFFVVGTAAYIIVEYILQRKRHNRWNRYFSNKVELPDYMRTPSKQKKDKK